MNIISFEKKRFEKLGVKEVQRINARKHNNSTIDSFKKESAKKTSNALNLSLSVRLQREVILSQLTGLIGFDSARLLDDILFASDSEYVSLINKKNANLEEGLQDGDVFKIVSSVIFKQYGGESSFLNKETERKNMETIILQSGLPNAIFWGVCSGVIDPQVIPLRVKCPRELMGKILTIASFGSRFSESVSIQSKTLFGA